MVVDERARRLFYDRLQEVLWIDGTDALMAHLPPAGRGDVATRQDLEHLSESLMHRFERIDGQVELLSERIDRQSLSLSEQGEELSERIDRQGLALLERIDRHGEDFTTAMQQNSDLLRADLQTLRHELMSSFRQELDLAVTAQTRTMIFTMARTVLILGSLVLGVLGLQ